MCRALKEAQCRWWQHPENSACHDMSGAVNKCKPGDVPCKAANGCDAAAQRAFSTPGQCFEGNGASCAAANCDCVEFYHKVHLCWMQDSGCYVYELSKTAGGFPAQEWSADNSAEYRASVIRNLEKTDGGKALLKLFDEVATGTFKLPKAPTSDDYTTTPTGGNGGAEADPDKPGETVTDKPAETVTDKTAETVDDKAIASDAFGLNPTNIVTMSFGVMISTVVTL